MVESLARRDRDRRRPSDAGHLLSVRRRSRLLEPKRDELLEPLGEADRAGRGELAVRSDQQIAAVADGIPNLADVLLRPREFLEARLARVERRVRARGVELQRRETEREVLGGAFCAQIRVDVDVGRIAFRRIEVRVRAQSLVHQTAEQLVHGLADRLADDVPARHLDPAQHAYERDVGPARVSPSVDVPPQGLDAKRIGSVDVVRKDVLDHALDDAWSKRRTVHLADALDAVVRDEFEEDEIAAAERRRRIADDPCSDPDDPHRDDSSPTELMDGAS